MTDTVSTLAADAQRLLRVRDLIATRLGKTLASLRVLDLACRVGAFAIPLATDGCHVVAVEHNPANLARMRELLPVPGLRLVAADVREHDAWAGRYDVTLCLGLLYHLDADSAFGLLQRLAECTTGICIIDTQVGTGDAQWTVDGQTYTGSTYRDVPGHPWGSVGNETSAWFDQCSLVRLITHAGFASVMPVPDSSYPDEPSNRLWLVAQP